MRGIHNHLTFANVVSVVALFVALGGTAIASVIITTNSQVAQNTISGHHPPTGKHANLISDSINGPDVQDLVFHNLTLKNGWVGNCGSGGPPAIAKSVQGVVYFRGEMCRNSGTSTNPFAVPAGFVPTKVEYIPVDEYGGYTGRIEVFASGQAMVRDDPGFSGAAAGFTSLVGASYTLPF